MAVPIGAMQFAAQAWPNYFPGGNLAAWTTLPQYLKDEAIRMAPATTPPAPVGVTAPGALMSPAQMAALRESILTSLQPAIAGQGEARAALSPFLTGMPGFSPITDAAIEAFKVKTLPLIQQQMTLKGLGHSPAVSQVTGEMLAEALPQFITQDMTNRLRAAELAGTMGQGAAGLAGTVGEREANLGLSGTRLAADIANAEAMRELEGFRSAGQLQLGLTDAMTKAGQLQQEQQKLALQAGQGAGGVQRDIAQQVSDAFQAERLRLQGLSEAGSFGVFGGQILPPSLSATTRTKSSGSSK